MAPLKVAIITASTRTPRVGPHVTKFIHETIAEKANTDNVTLEDVDLADFNLPVFDEPLAPAMIPAHGTHKHEHSKKWSAEIAKHDAYVFVIPEYNYGIAGATKNAVDYLYSEWVNKPVVIISYGIGGGKTASEQLENTLKNMKLRVAKTRPSFAFEGGPTGPDTFAAIGQGALAETSLTAWGKQTDDVIKAFDELKELAWAAA
jgi:NAD(P)H-dependent FMN reductase